jgi:hypothetical protein
VLSSGRGAPFGGCWVEDEGAPFGGCWVEDEGAPFGGFWVLSACAGKQNDAVTYVNRSQLDRCVQSPTVAVSPRSQCATGHPDVGTDVVSWGRIRPPVKWAMEIISSC